MAVPDPVQEQQRLAKAGREYYMQFMLACLVLGDRPPGWNIPARPSDRGMRLLDRMDPFGKAAGGQPDFYWGVPAGRAARRRGQRLARPGGSVARPGAAVRAQDRAGQRPRRPGRPLPRPRPAPLPDLQGGPAVPDPRPRPHRPARPADTARYATATWDRVADHLEATWADAPNPDGAATRLFIQYLRTMIAAGVRPDAGTVAPAGGRQPVSADAVASPAPGTSGGGGGEGAQPDLDEALAVAALVEGDRRQRTYPFRWPSQAAAEAFRQQLTVRLSEEARAGRPRIAHARPWVWAASSSGRALSRAGDETGVELRFSYYR